MNCSYSDSFITQYKDSASKYKIKNYRQLSPKERTAIKENLANNRPVIIGAKLGDNFMKWGPSSGILKAPESYDYNGQHAYHAMAIVGYDDSKNAYRILNSWGTGWGENGLIWVDYDFFENGNGTGSSSDKFGFVAFVAQNIKSNVVDPNNDDSVTPTDNGADLLSYQLQFVQSSQTNCGSDFKQACDYDLYYQVHNEGATTIKVSDGTVSQWRIALAYYNASDATDIGIIYYDIFKQGGLASGTCTVKLDANVVKNGQKAEYCEWQIDMDKTSATSMIRNSSNPYPFSLPSTLTGDYYLILVADSEDNIADEVDEGNNYVWSTDKPITFANGKVSSSSLAQVIGEAKATASMRMNPIRSFDVTSHNLNAYTAEEIAMAMKIQKKIRSFMPKAPASKSVITTPKVIGSPVR